MRPEVRQGIRDVLKLLLKLRGDARCGRLLLKVRVFTLGFVKCNEFRFPAFLEGSGYKSVIGVGLAVLPFSTLGFIRGAL